MVQDLIVGMIVVASAIYAVWLLAPAGFRRAGAAALASAARLLGLDAQASRLLQVKLAEHSGCGDCTACTHCTTLRRPPPPRALAAGPLRREAAIEHLCHGQEACAASWSEMPSAPAPSSSVDKHAADLPRHKLP